LPQQSTNVTSTHRVSKLCSFACEGIENRPMQILSKMFEHIKRKLRGRQIFSLKQLSREIRRI